MMDRNRMNNRRSMIKGNRLDVVLLLSGIVFYLEFKIEQRPLGRTVLSESSPQRFFQNIDSVPRPLQQWCHKLQEISRYFYIPFLIPNGFQGNNLAFF